jgi:restriction endonuclease Mrr
MPIAPVTHFRVPQLQLLGDGVERPLHEAANALADVFKLTPEEREAVLPSGYPVVRHRPGWEGFHLRKAGRPLTSEKPHNSPTKSAASPPSSPCTRSWRSIMR